MSNYILTANGQLYQYDPAGESELYHYGVPGMKWGQRKAAYASEKNAYKKSVKAYKNARKDMRKAASGFGGFGIKGIANVAAKEKKVNKAELAMIDAKAKYKGAKSKDSKKAEFNVYRKEMQKTGLVNSYADRSSGGRSGRIYDRIKETKGKAYADKVQKKVQNVGIAQFATAATVGVGLAVVNGILQAKQ